MENNGFSKLQNDLFSNTVITTKNVKDFGEFIAVTSLKKAMSYSGKSLDNIYAGLVHDIFDYKDASENYSIGYDIAQTAICFLCEYIGKGLETKFETDKHGHINQLGKLVIVKFITL